MRLDDRAAMNVAKRIATDHRHAWSYMAAVLRAALIDAGIMAHVARAWASDADKPFTPTDLVQFRDRVIELLSDGIACCGSGRITFRIGG